MRGFVLYGFSFLSKEILHFYLFHRKSKFSPSDQKAEEIYFHPKVVKKKRTLIRYVNKIQWQLVEELRDIMIMYLHVIPYTFIYLYISFISNSSQISDLFPPSVIANFLPCPSKSHFRLLTVANNHCIPPSSHSNSSNRRVALPWSPNPTAEIDQSDVQPPSPSWTTGITIDRMASAASSHIDVLEPASSTSEFDPWGRLNNISFYVAIRSWTHFHCGLCWCHRHPGSRRHRESLSSQRGTARYQLDWPHHHGRQVCRDQPRRGSSGT